MDAIWTRAAELPRFPPLKRDLQTDVLLIGGGLAGLLCAWREGGLADRLNLVVR